MEIFVKGKIGRLMIIILTLYLLKNDQSSNADFLYVFIYIVRVSKLGGTVIITTSTKTLQLLVPVYFYYNSAL